MKKAKRITLFAVSALLISVLTACGSSDNSMDENDMADNSSVNDVTSGADKNNGSGTTNPGTTVTPSADNNATGGTGSNIVDDVIDGVTNGVDNITDGVTNGADSITDGANAAGGTSRSFGTGSSTGSSVGNGSAGSGMR